jgi:hypothetical protein
MDYEEIQRNLAKLDTVVAVKRAAREPHANRLTTIFKRGAEGYTCVASGLNKRGQTVVFYVSNYVNVAGYILTWKSTYQKNGKKITTDLTAFKSRGAAVACAKRRAKKLEAYSQVKPCV